MRQRNAKHSLLCVTSALWSNADATTTPMQEQLPLSVIVTAENCCATAERSSCKGTGKDIFNNISIMEPWQKSVGAGMNHSKIVIPLTNRNEHERPRRALPFSSKSCSRDRRQSQVVFISAGVTEQEFRGRTRRLLFVYLLSELPSVIPFFPPTLPRRWPFVTSRTKAPSVTTEGSSEKAPDWMRYLEHEQRGHWPVDFSLHRSII